jgi:hypothetical protein
MNAALDNAKRLAEDARLMFENKRGFLPESSLTMEEFFKTGVKAVHEL